MVAKVGTRKESQDNLGGYLAGVQDNRERKGNTVGEGRGYTKGSGREARWTEDTMQWRW